jgi:tryptophanyl-tRNA synthetase
LGEGGKMSASEPETSIFTTDQPDAVKKKIWNAFTGGKPTLAEQKKHGGSPEVCTIYQYFTYLFEEDDRKLSERERKCRTGEVMCGDCKKELADRINKFLAEHQKKREKAKNIIEKFNVKR